MRTILSWVTYGYLACLGLCTAAIFTAFRETRFFDIAGPIAVQCTVCFILGWALFLNAPGRITKLYQRWSGIARRAGRSASGVGAGMVSELGTAFFTAIGVACLLLAILGLLMLVATTVTALVLRLAA